MAVDEAEPLYTAIQKMWSTQVEDFTIFTNEEEAAVEAYLESGGL